MSKPELVILVDQLLDYFEVGEASWPTCSVVNSDGYQAGLVEDKLYTILMSLQEFSNDYAQETVDTLDAWQSQKLASKHYNLWQDSDD